MKVKVDSYLKAENLNGATMKSPLEAMIVSTKLIPAKDLNFKSEEDRWELRVSLGSEKIEEYDWTPNKTSLREIIKAHGDESDAWAGKTVKLYSVTENVSGEMKEVVYCVV